MDIFILIKLIALVIVGLVLVVLGGNLFVDSAIALAEKAKMPKVLIGATIVSIGTTLPEIVVSLTAAAKGDVALAISNATGTMMCNLLLVLGLGLAFAIITAKRKVYMEKFIFSILATLLTLIFMIDMKIALWENIILLIVFATFMVVNITEALKANRQSKTLALSANTQNSLPEAMHSTPVVVQSTDTIAEKPQTEKKKKLWQILLFFVLGAVAIAIGADLLVKNVSSLAIDFMKIPIEIVGVTIIAFGTSLPEFVTAINSIRKKSVEMSLGNILGANIINGTFLLGVSGIIQGTAGLMFEGSLTILLSVIGLFIGLLITIIPTIIKQRTYKWQGITMLALYVAFIAFLIVTL